MRIFKSLDNLPEFKNAVVTIGTFDGVHKGHQKILEHISTLANEINGESILITFHPHPRFVINPDDKTLKLINTLEEKLELLQTYGLDNVVVAPFSVAFSQMPAIEYVKNFLVGNFAPKSIVIGYDHHFGRNRSGNISLLKEYKEVFDYDIVEITKEVIADIDVSSTKIRKSIEAGDMETAKVLMGHPYALEGVVTKGEQNGRKMGYPTANISLSAPYKLVPKNGVYAVRTNRNGKEYIGMLNIGFRPTFEGIAKSIEVHLIDFDNEIYGEKLKVEFISFIRDERKFDSLDALKQQLNQDKSTILSKFDK